ncbi:MAG: alginate export family protein [Bacteroidetes bacterium]|nr:alginate export family protein [Bacteroidota bacterium]
MTKFILILFFVFLTNSLLAQFSVKGEFRPRGEVRDGYTQLPDSSKDPSVFVSQRSRLTFDYSNSKYITRFSIQDIRVWGDETLYNSTLIKGDNASVDVHEAWVELFLNEKSTLKIGRQELTYDDQRLISRRNWGQTGISYDAFIYKFNNNNNFEFNLGLSLNNNKENKFGNLYTPDKMKTLDFIYLKKKFNDNLNVSLISIASGYEKENTSETIYVQGSYGTNIVYQKNNLKIKGSAYYQNGKNKTGQDVSAYFFGISDDYKFNKIVLTTGLDFLSGQDASNTDSSYIKTDHLFDILYGSRTSHYGSMGYFLNLDQSTGSGGLFNVFAKIKYQFFEKNTINFNYHLLMLANNVADNTYTGSGFKSLNKNLGSEFDFVFTRKYRKDIKFQFGYSFLLATNSLKIIQNVIDKDCRLPQWAWVMLTVSPDIFKSKK